MSGVPLQGSGGPGELLLELRDVSLSFDAHGRGVVDVCLELHAGDVGVVAGARDAGKTTLLRLAGGALSPDDGEILLMGRDVSALPPSERGGLVAWACRSGPGTLRASMLDYVSLPLVSGARLGNAELERRALAVLQQLGVAHCAALEWSEMSVADRVRVELAQAIVRCPRLLLVDDLLDGLSTQETRRAMRLLRSLAANGGFGVLMTSADLGAAPLAHRLWMVEEGRLWAMDEPGADIEDPGGRLGLDGPVRKVS